MGCLPSLTYAQESEFTTPAPFAVIMDYETGMVLFEKNARTPMAPASMTKIMTADIVFEKLKNGSLSPDTQFTVSEEAWRRGGAKSGSSTMFLELGSRVSISDLLKGVVIQSGNDACIVLAEGISGSETAFADLMTRRAREIGLESATFRNATGWPHPEHRISTYDLAKLAKHSIETYPDYYPIYAETSFIWNDIRQGNRNPLLGKMTGADGLKTGHTESSGYGFVGSAVRNGIRRIIVVNGLESKVSRQNESIRLMQAAFDQFQIYDLYEKDQIIGSVPVFMGKAETVEVALLHNIRSALFRADRKNVTAKMEHKETVAAPIAKGDTIATLIINEPGKAPREFPLVATTEVKAKSALSKAWTVLLNTIRG